MDASDQLRALAAGHVPTGHLPSRRTSSLVREVAENPEPGSAEWVATRTLEELTRLPDALRQTLTDKLWQTIPSYVEEFGRNDAWSTTSPVVQWPCEFYELIIVERVVVSIPSGSTGTLQLGGHVFPNLPAGITNLSLGKLLDGTAARTLTLVTGAGGQATVALYGHQLPTTGSMSP